MADDPKDNPRWRRFFNYLGGVGGIVGLFGLYVGWRSLDVAREALNDTRRIATDSGSLDRPTLEFKLGNVPLAPTLPVRVCLGVPFEKERAVHIGFLPFHLVDSGKKTAEDISVLDRFPKIGRSLLKNVVTAKVEGFQPLAEGLKRDIQDIGEYSCYFYNFPRLNPSMEMGFDSPFLMEPTQFDEIVPVNKERGFRVKGDYALNQMMTISSKDQPEANYPFNIEMRDAKKFDDVIDAIKPAIFERLEKQRQALRFPAFYVVTVRESVIVGFATPELVSSSEEGKLYTVKYKDGDIHSVTFEVSPDNRWVVSRAIGFLVMLVILSVLASMWRGHRRRLS